MSLRTSRKSAELILLSFLEDSSINLSNRRVLNVDVSNVTSIDFTNLSSISCVVNDPEGKRERRCHTVALIDDLVHVSYNHRFSPSIQKEGERWPSLRLIS